MWMSDILLKLTVLRILSSFPSGPWDKTFFILKMTRATLPMLNMSITLRLNSRHLYLELNIFLDPGRKPSRFEPIGSVYFVSWLMTTKWVAHLCLPSFTQSCAFSVRQTHHISWQRNLDRGNSWDELQLPLTKLHVWQKHKSSLQPWHAVGYIRIDKHQVMLCIHCTL